MPFIPVPDCARVEIRFTRQNEQCENVIWARAASINQAALDILTAFVGDWAVNEYLPLMSANVSYRETYARDMTAAEGVESTDVTGSATIGGIATATSQPLPANVTACVSLRTGFTGRSARGRLYTIGMVESHTNGSTVETSYQTSIINALGVLQATFAIDANWEWVVVSLYSGVDAEGDPIPRAEGRPLPITEVLFVDAVSDSQRRRLPGRGH